MQDFTRSCNWGFEWCACTAHLTPAKSCATCDRMEQAAGARLDLDKVESAICTLFDQAVELQAQTVALNAETMKLSAELAKLQHEHHWYPVVVATTLTAAVIGATAALTKLLIGS